MPRRRNSPARRPRDQHPLVLAFQLGRLCNEFNWHLRQAVITTGQDLTTRVASVLDRIEVSLLSLALGSAGGEARQQVIQLRQQWISDAGTIADVRQQAF